ncbi:MAG: hypothetical protein GY720_17105 [bacterium]|nr:hypothetical protein [bacterium]
MTIGFDQEPPTLNPFVPGGDSHIVLIIGQALHAGAYDVDAETLEMTPELVEEIPSVANGLVELTDSDEMLVTWRIRDEAVWSDGVPVSGADFEFTLEAEQGMCGGHVDRFYDPQIVDVQPKSITLGLSPALLYESIFRIVVPAHAVEDSDWCNDWNDKPWPSAGPFVFDSWDKGKSLRVVRNERYWKADEESGEQLPFLDAVVFAFEPERADLVTALEERRIDVLLGPTTSAKEIVAPELEALLHTDAEVQVLPGPVWEHLNFQFGPANPNEDSLNRYAEFRRAIAYALDRETLASDSGWIPLDGFLTAHTPSASTEPWAVYNYDPARAHDLIEVACRHAERDCVADPPVLQFRTTNIKESRRTLANNLEKMLEDVGVEVQIDLFDPQLMFGDPLEAGAWDVSEWSWVGSPGAASAAGIFDVLDPDAPPPDGDNYFRWGTPNSTVVDDDAVSRFRALLTELKSTADRDRALVLAGEAEGLLAAEVVIIPLGARPIWGASWPSAIQGFVPYSGAAGPTWNIEYWYQPGG